MVMNILVIENEPASLKLAEIVLREEGSRVRGVADAWQALDEIARERPDVILLDLALPVVDGLTLARQIKNDPETRDIFIITFTSFPEEFKRKEALAAGCDAYLLKPMDAHYLHLQIEALFRNKSK
jgi:CheY-like chemotaxis protein